MDILQQFEKRGFRADGCSFQSGRPDQKTIPLLTHDGQGAVAKIYTANNGARTHANMVELWNSSFGRHRRPPGLPEPLTYDPELRAVIMRRVAGSPLVERDHLDDEVLEQTALLLAALHESDAQPSQIRDAHHIVKSIRRKSEKIGGFAPDLQKSYENAANALAQFDVEDAELVPSHGDFSPRNVLISNDRLLLIDWDRFQQADPARDVSYFGVWCWASAWRQKKEPTWRVLEKIIAFYSSCRPLARVKDRLPFHMAAGLLRIAASLVELWPSESYVAPFLIEEAILLLKGRSLFS